MARQDPYAAVDAFFAVISRHPEFRPYYVEAVAECESKQAGYEGHEEVDRSFTFGERACSVAVEGHGRPGTWRSQVEAALASGGYSPSARDSGSFRYMRYLNDVAEHVEELERLATLGSRGAGLAWPQRAATEMVRVDPPADSYWAIVQQVRQSSFRPTHWRFGAELRSSVRGESGQNYWVIAAPTHDGWHEGSSVFVQVLTDDAVAVSSAARTAVRSALAAKRYRSLRGPVTAPDSALLSLRDESSASGAVREAVRVHEQLLAICAAH